jgi:hypothetical protein
MPSPEEMQQFLTQVRFTDQGILLADVIPIDPRVSTQVDQSGGSSWSRSGIEGIGIILCRWRSRRARQLDSRIRIGAAIKVLVKFARPERFSIIGWARTSQ